MRTVKSCGILTMCFLLVLSTTVFAAEMIHCPKCGTRFEANGTYVGRMAGAASGAATGAYIGAGIGVAIPPFGAIAGTIPGAIIGGFSGLLLGGSWDNNVCPLCGHKFAQ